VEITANEITREVKSSLVKRLEAIFGKSIKRSEVAAIEKYIVQHLESESRCAYKRHVTHISDVMAEIVSMPHNPSADSKAELIVRDYLKEAGVPFRFQFKIGPYKVDFLIAEYLAFEINGPHHSEQEEEDWKRRRYIEEMGYEYMAVDIATVFLSPDKVIEKLKQYIDRGGLELANNSSSKGSKCGSNLAGPRLCKR